MQIAQGDIAQTADADASTEVPCRPNEIDADEKRKRDWALIVSVPYRIVRRVAFKYTRNLPLAELVVSETYIRAIEAMGTYQGGDNPRSIRAFLMIIARNIAFEWRRREKSSPVEYVSNLSKLGDATHCDNSGSPLQSDMDRAVVNEVFDYLTPRRRQVLLLQLIDGLSTEDIATLLGICPSTVRKTVSVAKNQLRTILTKRGLRP